MGAPGVFVGYHRGTNPFLSDPSVYRVDTGQATRLTKKDGELISLAAAPGGRLWAFWKVENSLRATRSNPAATKWGQIVSIKAPKSTSAVWQGRGRRQGQGGEGLEDHQLWRQGELLAGPRLLPGDGVEEGLRLAH
jgi:hypothetical protein